MNTDSKESKRLTHFPGSDRFQLQSDGDPFYNSSSKHPSTRVTGRRPYGDVDYRRRPSSRPKLTEPYLQHSGGAADLIPVLHRSPWQSYEEGYQQELGE
jgi:hypothetical protein